VLCQGRLQGIDQNHVAEQKLRNAFVRFRNLDVLKGAAENARPDRERGSLSRCNTREDEAAAPTLVLLEMPDGSFRRRTRIDFPILSLRLRTPGLHLWTPEGDRRAFKRNLRHVFCELDFGGRARSLRVTSPRDWCIMGSAHD
jgi:hypothetical protein